MKRWHQDYQKSRRNWWEHRQLHVCDNLNQSIGPAPYQRAPGQSPFVVHCECDEQIGRFRKRDAYDCGNTKCFVCHSDKYPKRKRTVKELQSDSDFKESIKEFYDHFRNQE